MSEAQLQIIVATIWRAIFHLKALNWKLVYIKISSKNEKKNIYIDFKQ